MVRTILSVLIFAVLVSGCSPFSPSPLGTPSAPDLGETWTLKMEHSGGITGLSRSIEISSDGTYTVHDDDTDRTIEGKLSAADLSDLTELLSTVDPASVPDVEDTGCADCYVYSVEFRSGERSLNAQVNDITLADSGLEPLVTFLRGIMEKALR